jgi:hypothetical protein
MNEGALGAGSQANKMARIVWALLTRGEVYQAPKLVQGTTA